MMEQPSMPNLMAEVSGHFNEPMLLGFDLARCIGYGEDDMDCYVIVRHQGGRVIWHTMVGGYVFLDRLRGQSPAGPWDDLSRLDSLLALNGCPLEAEMRVEIITPASPPLPEPVGTEP